MSAGFDDGYCLVSGVQKDESVKIGEQGGMWEKMAKEWDELTNGGYPIFSHAKSSDTIGHEIEFLESCEE